MSTAIDSAALEMQFLLYVRRAPISLAVVMHSLRHPATNTKNIIKFEYTPRDSSVWNYVVLMKLKALVGLPPAV
jgi:hypothetical protein